ncbi:MAG: helicase RepA family protein [Desulfobulbaceae bacterium]|nr:helicase RepA family protein [Desulfobulbaceae bacterium]
MGGGELSETEARASLEQAAEACGLRGVEVGKTLESGLTAGKKEPRSVPDNPQATKTAPPSGTTTQATSQPERRRFTLTHGADLPDTPPQWLVEDFITVDSLGLIFGDSEAGKSFLAIALACAVASGEPFFNRMVRQSPVVYIAGEGNTGLKRRVKAWAIHHNRAMATIPIYFSNTAIPLDDPGNLAQVETAIDEAAAIAGQPELIIIDTLARSYGGDENATQDMNGFIAALDALRLRYSAAIIVVHHTGHMEKGRARGSSALRAALDFEYCFASIDGGDLRKLAFTKVKDFERPAAMHFRLTPVEVAPAGTDGNLDLPDTVPVLELADYEPPTPPSRAGQGKNQIKVLDILHGLSSHTADGNLDRPAGITREAWRDECLANGFDRFQFRRAEISLENQGVITETNGYITLKGCDVTNG